MEPPFVFWHYARVGAPSASPKTAMNKPLYDQDFFAWTQTQADALRRRSANELDWDNLVEEIDSMGRQQRSELHSHFTPILEVILNDAYAVARLRALRETRLSERALPPSNPFTFDEAMSSDLSDD
jgi:hypothetical protein